MVRIPFGMVLADGGEIATFLPLVYDGAHIARIVFGARKKLLGGEFGEVMFEAMPENPAMGSVPNDAVTMFQNGM